MNRDTVIALARESCPYTSDELRGAFYDGFMKASALVAAAEREACVYRANIALLGADRGLANRVNQAIRNRT